MAQNEGDESDTRIAAGHPKPGPSPSSGADASGATNQPKPASALRGCIGIGSLFLAILASGLSGVVLVGIKFLPDPPPRELPEIDGVVITLAVITVAVPILAFVGLMLGSIGALLGLIRSSSRTGTICAFLGLGFNTLILAVFVLLMWLGVAIIGLGCFHMLKIFQHHPRRN